MTETEARNEALRRWGPYGSVWTHRTWWSGGGHEDVPTVGIIVDKLRRPLGHGATWEEAFAHADRAQRFDLGRAG